MYNDYVMSSDAVAGFAGAAAIMGGLSIAIMFFSLILSLILIISMWKIFAKAGKPGWASIIPIYNIIVMLEIVGLPTWNIILFLIPFANIYIMFKLYIELAKKFGKSTGFGIGMIFLPIIFFPMLAFSDSKIDGVVSETSNNSFDATNVITNNATMNSVNEMNVEPNNMLDNNVNIGPVSYEMNQVEVNPVSNPVIPEVVEPVVNDMNIGVVNQMENVNPVNVENNIVDGNAQIDNINITPVQELTNQNEMIVETNINNTVPVQEMNVANEPVLKQQFNNLNTVEPVNMEIQSNSINPVQNVIEPVIPVSEPVVNAFNSIPNSTPVDNVINNVDTLNIESQVVEQQINPSLSDVVSEKKYCKNCGNELPSIVSICPNCGTDNE